MRTEIELLSDQSTFIRDAVDDVKNAALIGRGARRSA